MATKAEQALAVPELLQMILLELPQCELLLSQRVNKRFYQAVTQTPAIQQKLFYGCAPGIKHQDGQPPTLNPILEHIFEAIGRDGSPRLCRFVTGPKGRISMSDSNVECEFVDGGRLHHTPELGEENAIDGSEWHVNVSTLADTGGLGRVKLLRGDSWRGMWASQPPCPLYAIHYYHAGAPAVEGNGDVVRMPIAKLGEWVDALRKGDAERVAAGLPTFAGECYSCRVGEFTDSDSE